MPTANSRLSEVLDKREQEITGQWIEQQQATGRKLTAAEREHANRQSREFVRSLKSALQRNSTGDISGPDWVRRFGSFCLHLSSGGRKMATLPGKRPRSFFLSSSRSLRRCAASSARTPQALADEIWLATLLSDKLGLLTDGGIPEERAKK